MYADVWNSQTITLETPFLGIDRLQKDPTSPKKPVVFSFLEASKVSREILLFYADDSGVLMSMDRLTFYAPIRPKNDCCHFEGNIL